MRKGWTDNRGRYWPSAYRRRCRPCVRETEQPTRRNRVRNPRNDAGCRQPLIALLANAGLLTLVADEAHLHQNARRELSLYDEEAGILHAARIVASHEHSWCVLNKPVVDRLCERTVDPVGGDQLGTGSVF